MIKVVYEDIALGAKVDFQPTISEMTQFSKLQQIKEDIDFPDYGNPIESFSVILDGSVKALPSNPENIGVWSESVASESGVFDSPILLMFSAVELYTSSGLSLMFDTQNNIRPKNVTVSWYRGNEWLSTKDFVVDSSSYFFKNKVENYNKVVFEFKSMNTPKTRLRLRSVEFGIKVGFGGDELRAVNVSQKSNLISSELPISSTVFVADSKLGVDFSFQEAQPVKTYFNDKLQSTTFVTKAKRQSKSIWNVSTEDYIGILENTPFVGGIYSKKNAVELLTEIFTKADVPFYISSDFDGETVSGWIPYTNCRDALMQVAFAICASVSTACSDVVNVIKPTQETKTITLDSIMQGLTVEEEAVVTTVSVTSHRYKAIDEETIAYEADESGTGGAIQVKFVEPLHDLEITNGIIVLSGANYALINAFDGCVLIGKRYKDITQTKIQKNTNVSTLKENAVSITSATLVSRSNVDKVLENCYNYFTRNKTVKAKIIESGTPTKVLDLVEVETDFSGVLEKRITEQRYSLVGNILVKESVMV
jgi:hypothetical protein